MVYLLSIELLMVLGVGVAVATGPVPTWWHWVMAGILLGCASAHAYRSRVDEERRRSVAAGPLINVTSIWTFPAALVLPMPLVVLVILVVRIQLYVIARRPMYRFLFSTSSILLAALAVNTLNRMVGPVGWTANTVPEALFDSALLAVSMLADTGVQALLVAGVIVMTTRRPSMLDLFGSREDNQLELKTLVLGGLVALALVRSPLLVPIMVPVAVNFNKIRKLEQDVADDELTELLNRRGWQQRAERALARANYQAALLILDLDHFKSINDTYGHVAGDDMLRAVANLLRDSTRTGDVVGRWGGEEFIVLLPDASRAEAQLVAGRIREGVEGLRVLTTHKRGGGRVIIDKRTISVGLGISPEHGPALADLIKATDNALYRAKESGRNRVYLAALPPEQPKQAS